MNGSNINLTKNPEAAYFIETLARKYFYHNLVEDSASKVAYEKYLSELLLSPYNAGISPCCLSIMQDLVCRSRQIQSNFKQSYHTRYGSSSGRLR